MYNVLFLALFHRLFAVKSNQVREEVPLLPIQIACLGIFFPKLPIRIAWSPGVDNTVPWKYVFIRILKSIFAKLILTNTCKIKYRNRNPLLKTAKGNGVPPK